MYEVADYAGLRQLTTSTVTVANVLSPAGLFIYDPTDTTSADNGGTIIVGNDGRRWKRPNQLQGEVMLEWFGGKGDGVSGSYVGTDNTPAFLAAAASLSGPNGGGGIIRLGPLKYDMNGPLDLRPYPGVTIKGPYTSPDVINPDGSEPIQDLSCIQLSGFSWPVNLTTTNGNKTATVDSAVHVFPGMVINCTSVQTGTFVSAVNGTTIILSQAATTSGTNSASVFATICLGSKCGLDGVAVLYTGLSYPAQDSGDFLGNAIVVGGDGAFLHNVFVGGFINGLLSNGFGRVMLDKVYSDCINDIYIAASWDSSSLPLVHIWPFLTAAQYNTALAQGGTAAANAYRLQRAGAGINLQVGNDNTTIGSALVFGKLNNVIINASTVSAASLWSDNTGFYVGSTGVTIGASATGVEIANLYSFNSAVNLQVNLAAGNNAAIASAYLSTTSNQNCVLAGGDITFGTLASLGAPAGYAVAVVANCNLTIGTLVDRSNAGANPVTLLVTGVPPEAITIDRLISDKPAGNSVVGTNVTSLTSIPGNSNPLAVPINGDTFVVTGALSGISGIAGASLARLIFLYFDTGGTIFAGGNTSLTSNLTISAGEVVMAKWIPNHGKWHLTAMP